MKINQLQLSSHRAPKRVGRGIAAGGGKTAGRGHKGQKSRAGGFHKVGFEGGQMPLQRRLPKIGFRSALGRRTAEVRLSELHKIEGGNVDLAILKSANLVPANTLQAKIVLSGDVKSAFTVSGVGVTKGARTAIEKAGGKVVEASA